MVAKYEYWSHRLFPKMKFNDVVERLEKLGEKREVKVNFHKNYFKLNCSNLDHLTKLL
jgi:hypothetical protein